MIRHRFQNNAGRHYLGPGADLNIAQDLGAGSDENAAADFRVSVAGLLAGAAEGD